MNSLLKTLTLNWSSEIISSNLLVLQNAKDTET